MAERKGTKAETDRLYGLPLDEFTGARNAAARELRRSGDREAAEEVAALKKPTLPAWAINQLVRGDRAGIRKVLDAGKRLRAAQEGALGGGSGAKLREAAAKEREAVERAIGRLAEILDKPLSAPNLQRVRGSLHAAASDEEARAAIEAGRLTADHEPIGLGSFAGAVAPPRKPKPRQTAASRRKLESARKAERTATRTLDAAKRAADSRREAAERAAARLAEAQAELDEAKARADEATALRERAEAERS